MSERELYANLDKAIKEVFQMYVGGGDDQISYTELSARTKIKETALYDFNKTDTHLPKLARLFLIVSHLPEPADAMDRILKVIGLGAHTLTGDICYFTLQASCGHLLSVTSKALEDGIVNHQESHQIAMAAIPASDHTHRAINPGGRKIAHTGHNGYSGVLNVRSN
jgi:hypothetical protein